MTQSVTQLNLTVAWVWVVLGTLLGLILGSLFHRERFLDGYGSFKRRLYRLAHVAFFGLAILNILFFFTVRILPASTTGIAVASWSFLLGALSMPTCCLLVAHQPRLRTLFVIPVGSVLLGSFLTLREVWLL